MSTPRNLEELEAWIEQHRPVGKTTKSRAFGGKVSEAGQLFSQIDVEAVTEDGLESLSLITTSSCSFGHLLGSGGIEIAGTCTICGSFVCTAEQCARTCVKGHVVCGMHSIIIEEGVFCSGHLPPLLLRKGPFLAGKVFKAIKWATERW